MENIEEKTCLCALNKIFGFAPKTGLALISHLGSASEVFRMNRDDLDRLLGPHSRYKDQISRQALKEAESELLRLQDMDISFIGWTEKDYPELLRECEDAPVGLYIRSTTPPHELWAPGRRIAVVGTRDISPYGREWCVRTVTGLASSSERPAIISGLALGTDFCAHKTALEFGLPTIAVMATGPEDIYPYRHREFAKKLYRTPGCALVTDYPPGTAPLAIHFLRRNRIIAGLSDATILIESKLKGGGMMTSRLAFSYSREVFALPGRVDDIRSQGCNKLISNKIAEPLTSIEDLLESLSLHCISRRRDKSQEEILKAAYAGKLSDEKISILTGIAGIIRKERGISISDIASMPGLSYSLASTMTGLLEADGFISIDILQRCTPNPEKFR